MKKINSKLFGLLESFSAEEKIEFRKYISSPYVNKGRNYSDLLDKILKTGKGKERKVFKSNTGLVELENSEYSKQTLRNRFSELYKLGEEFLLNKWLSQNSPEKDNILLNILLEKKLNNQFKYAISESLKKIKDKKLNPDVLESITAIRKIRSRYLQDIKKEEMLYNEFYENSKYILCRNLISIFEMGIEFLNQEADNRKYEPNFNLMFLKQLKIDYLISEFRRTDNLIFKITAMNYHLFKAFEDHKNEKDYYMCRKIFREIISGLEESYKIYLFLNMINYCIRKNNSGISKFNKELFELYKEKLDQNLFSDLYSKSYSFNHFRDYVIIGLENLDFNWVRNFIKKYSEYLPDELRENEIRLSNAKLDFAEKNFKSSISNLLGIKSSHYLLYIDISIYKLYNYYELGDYEEAYPEMERLNQFFRNNNRIPEIHLNFNKNFLSQYKRLIKLKTEPRSEIQEEEIHFIEEEIRNMEQVTGKKWLLRKISELMK